MSPAAGPGPGGASELLRAVRRAARTALRENLNLKIIAAALAVVAWIMVQGRPTAEEYSEVRLDFVWPENLVLEGDPLNQVLVKAVGPRTNLREMAKRDLRYRIDLSDSAPGETNINLIGMEIMDLPSSLEITTISPATLTFGFDEKLTKALQVEVPTRGEPAFGFEVEEIVVEPNVVAISGAQPDLESVEVIRTRALDLAGRDHNFAEILALDMGAMRARPEHDAEVSVYVKLKQVVEQREIDVSVAVPESMEGMVVEPARATVVLHGPARELHRVMASAFRLEVVDGAMTQVDGVATLEVDRAGTGGEEARVILTVEGLPDSVTVLEVQPGSLTLRRQEQ
jgi:YbbR domain-containing protein